MFQSAGDLGLQKKSLAADRIVGMLLEDLLERHLAVQLVVQRDEDGTQTAPGVRPQDAKPLPVGRGRADAVRGRFIRISRRLRIRRANLHERLIDVGIT